ncbi:hypothetical protein FQN50_005236 [Emmonsiellopsis sp. PD_5]|nr:hypothetical protein FQN50_005236 [Emmonsiellopsis sp. PD_5]
MSRLDQLVKGAPPPTANLPFSASQTPSPPLRPPPYPEQHAHQQHQQPATAPPDPLSTLPSSPPQIYLNLLILESSLRSQYLALRARRRQNTFFLLLLALWIAYFSYALFLRPREDGRGVGGSVYWVVEMGEKMALMGGVVTGILVWGTGQWERGVRWPRRWLGVANRGLRGMNAKIVVVRGKWWWEALSYLSFVFPYSSFFPAGTSFQYIETTSSSHEKPAHTTHTSTHTHRRSRLSTVSSTSHPYDSDQDSTTTSTNTQQPTIIEEDLAPGGNYIKLLLLPKSFSPAFRENWDEYRTDYWERENERRAALRSMIKEQQRALAKSQGGWLWWAGWRGWGSLRGLAGGGKRPGTPSGHGHGHGHSQSSTTHYHHNKEPSTASSMKPSRRSNTPQLDPAAAGIIMTHSRTPSRSSTPNALSSDADEYSAKDRQRARRGSSATASGGEREKDRETGKRKGRKARSGTGSGSFSAGSGSGRERAPSPLTRIEPQPPVPRGG